MNNDPTSIGVDITAAEWLDGVRIHDVVSEYTARGWGHQHPHDQPLQFYVDAWGGDDGTNTTAIVPQLIRLIRELAAEVEQRADYADKLAASMAEGTLPKDMELLREASEQPAR